MPQKQPPPRPKQIPPLGSRSVQDPPPAHAVPPKTLIQYVKEKKRGETTSKYWMASFCTEPDDNQDCSTCCLGFFVPCALYGKTNWRLNQLTKLKDPLDSSWKSSYGCNGACWFYFFCGGMCFHLPAGMTRTRIRATYGMDGSCCGDWCVAMWCAPCVLMQNDREVRAREGVNMCRTNCKFGTDLLAPAVTCQPGLKPDMVARPSNSGPIFHQNDVFGGDKLNVLKTRRSDSAVIMTQPGPQAAMQPIAPTAMASSESSSATEDEVCTHPDCHNGEADEPVHPKIDLKELTAALPADTCVTVVIGCPNDTTPAFKRPKSAPRRLTKEEKAKQLSYVHEFSASGVDIDIMEFYEKEEQRLNAPKEPKETPSPTEDFYTAAAPADATKVRPTVAFAPTPEQETSREDSSTECYSSEASKKSSSEEAPKPASPGPVRTHSILKQPRIETPPPEYESSDGQYQGKDFWFKRTPGKRASTLPSRSNRSTSTYATYATSQERMPSESNSEKRSASDTYKNWKERYEQENAESGAKNRAAVDQRSYSDRNGEDDVLPLKEKQVEPAESLESLPKLEQPEEAPSDTISHNLKACTGVDGAKSPTSARERKNLSEALNTAFNMPEMGEIEKSRAVIEKTNALREFLARAKANQITYSETHSETHEMEPKRQKLGTIKDTTRERSPVPRGLDLNAINQARQGSRNQSRRVTPREKL